MKILNNKTLADDVTVLLKRFTFISLLLFCTSILQAQDFAITVTATPQTCPGNGSLSFTAQNATPSPITYQVFLQPNTTTPVANGTATTVSGLQAGTYLVIAMQNTNSGQVTAQQSAVISNQVVVINNNDVDIATTPAYCGNDGTITVTVNTGNPVSYQITVGPVTTATQTSSTFTNLPAGFYSIKITDNCGAAAVVSQSLFSISPTLTVSPGSFPDITLPDCNHITASNTIHPTLPSQPIIYPLTATYTVYPPSGNGPPVTFTQTIAAGDGQECVVNQVIPLYDDAYYYNLVITDQCGTPFTANNNQVTSEFFVIGNPNDAGCGRKFLQIVPSQFVPPFTVTFISYPPDFDPNNFSDTYPDPFNSMSADFGNATTPVPNGDYSFTVTDACGHTSIVSSTHIEEPEVDPIPSPSNTDCINGLGEVLINIPYFYIAQAVITTAPTAYTNITPLPSNVSFAVISSGPDAGKLFLESLPPGTYIFVITDTCGNVYDPLTVVIPPYTNGQLSANNRPGCDLGFGTIALTHSSPITSVIITAAPTGFTQTLPFDASAYIFEEDFYMDNLPPGSYTFDVATPCQPFTKTPVVIAYAITANNITHTAHCGSFDLNVQHTSTSIAGVGFWLQKQLDPVLDTWGHPDTGEEYLTGQPTGDNSLNVPNNTTTYSLIYPTGHYRVMKAFRAFGDGSIGQKEKTCTEVVYEFDYYNTLNILGAQNLTCSGNIADVQINALGVEPLNYTITQKNGLPFTINNGNNNVFTNLESAIYTVYVSDPCGNNVPLSFNVADLPSLVNASTAPDLSACDDDGNGTEDFDLSTQNAAVLDTQNPADVTLTYHASLSDAEAGSNILPTLLTTASATIYARVQYNTNTTCIAISAFDIFVRSKPVLHMREVWGGCEGEDITITADAGYTQYDWDNAAAGQIITVNQPGALTVTVIDAYGCTASATIQVITSALPVISDIEVTDWTEHDNIITVIMEGQGTASVQSFEYSLDGLTYQDSNIFNGLDPGNYAVFVRDKFGCGLAGANTHVLTYPKFFTPNGDGQNEKWRIKFSTLAEPDLMVYIYDRYGKLITGFGADSDGWDGTLNGATLPSTDYWFVVHRQNGKEFKGHFAMIR